MTNAQVVKAFENHRSGKSLNMESDGVKLWSYSTVIAEHSAKYGTIKNITKYSATTSKQSRPLCRYDVTVNDCYRGVYNLEREYEKQNGIK